MKRNPGSNPVRKQATQHRLSIWCMEGLAHFIVYYLGMRGFDSDYEIIRRVERDLFKRRKTINANYNEVRMAA